MVEDGELMERIRDDDETALREFIDRYREKVYRVALAHIRDREEAVDVAQEAFIRLHRARKRWDARARPFTWLYRITVNLCIDRIRKSRRQKHSVPDPKSPDLVAQGVIRQSRGPGARLAGKEKAREILRAVRELPAKQRTIFLLRHYEGLSLAEIAECEGCALGTVKSSLHRAIHALRRKLKAPGVLGDEGLPENTG